MTVPFSLRRLNFNKVTAELNSRLVEPFSEEEILLVIKSCNENKAQGPDDFNFYKRFWAEIKGHHMRLLNHFHAMLMLAGFHKILLHHSYSEKSGY